MFNTPSKRVLRPTSTNLGSMRTFQGQSGRCWAYPKLPPSPQLERPQVEPGRPAHCPVACDLPHHAAELKPMPRARTEDQDLRCPRVFVDNKILIGSVGVLANRRRFKDRLDRQPHPCDLLYFRDLID